MAYYQSFDSYCPETIPQQGQQQPASALQSLASAMSRAEAYGGGAAYGAASGGNSVFGAAPPPPPAAAEAPKNLFSQQLSAPRSVFSAFPVSYGSQGGYGGGGGASLSAYGSTPSMSAAKAASPQVDDILEKAALGLDPLTDPEIRSLRSNLVTQLRTNANPQPIVDKYLAILRGHVACNVIFQGLGIIDDDDSALKQAEGAAADPPASEASAAVKPAKAPVSIFAQDFVPSAAPVPRKRTSIFETDVDRPGFDFSSKMSRPTNYGMGMGMGMMGSSLMGSGFGAGSGGGSVFGKSRPVPAGPPKSLLTSLSDMAGYKSFEADNNGPDVMSNVIKKKGIGSLLDPAAFYEDKVSQLPVQTDFTSTAQALGEMNGSSSLASGVGKKTKTLIGDADSLAFEEVEGAGANSNGASKLSIGMYEQNMPGMGPGAGMWGGVGGGFMPGGPLMRGPMGPFGMPVRHPMMMRGMMPGGPIMMTRAKPDENAIPGRGPSGWLGVMHPARRQVYDLEELPRTIGTLGLYTTVRRAYEYGDLDTEDFKLVRDSLNRLLNHGESPFPLLALYGSFLPVKLMERLMREEMKEKLTESARIFLIPPQEVKMAVTGQIPQRIPRVLRAPFEEVEAHVFKEAKPDISMPEELRKEDPTEYELSEIPGVVVGKGGEVGKEFTPRTRRWLQSILFILIKRGVDHAPLVEKLAAHFGEDVVQGVMTAERTVKIMAKARLHVANDGIITGRPPKQEGGAAATAGAEEAT